MVTPQSQNYGNTHHRAMVTPHNTLTTAMVTLPNYTHHRTMVTPPNYGNTHHRAMVTLTT